MEVTMRKAHLTQPAFKTEILERLKFIRFGNPVVILVLPESQLLKDGVVLVDYSIAVSAVLWLVEFS